MFRLLIAASLRIRYFLRCYMPTNILADQIRTRSGHKWGPAAMLLAIPYFAATIWLARLIDQGAPAWLHLLVLLAAWNGFKMLWLGPISIAWLIRTRLAERACRRRQPRAVPGTRVSERDDDDAGKSFVERQDVEHTRGALPSSW